MNAQKNTATHTQCGMLGRNDNLNARPCALEMLLTSLGRWKLRRRKELTRPQATYYKSSIVVVAKTSFDTRT